MIEVMRDHPWVVWPMLLGAAMFTAMVLGGVWLMVRGFEGKVRAIVAESQATLIITVTKMFNDADRAAADSKRVALTVHHGLMDLEHKHILLADRVHSLEEKARAGGIT